MPKFEIAGYNGGFTVELSDVEVETLPEQQTRAQRDTPLEKRRIIAWDGEGMKLSGNDKPQHYVMFGCSAEPEWVMVNRNLGTMEILEYIIAVGERYPNAVHIGYGFRYDAFMIVKGLPDKHLRALKHHGEVNFKLGNIRWRIHIIPGKSFRVTKRWSTGKRNTGKRSGDGYVSVKIDDMASFFARPFLDACESILADVMTDEDREVIAHGKQARKDNQWEDLPEVQRYWRAEIRLMQMLAETFRDVMFNAGIRLKEWYGPGAIASFLISKRHLRKHLQNEPPIKEVHEASKVAYAGGRFELFRVGRIQGPVYGLDINSAYPAALSKAPSLGLDHGEWVHVANPSSIEEFGVYRITYNHRGKAKPVEFGAMPLFHRDPRGSISFPQFVNGWYWSPEAATAAAIGERYPGSVRILEGWVWRNDGTRPFEFLSEMFEERIRLGKKNVISMPYKLGPNSMYGKLAQRVGWNEKTHEPPKSHCLPLAGWITSSCRASLYRMMLQMPMHKLVAVETDGIYTTMSPDDLVAEYGDGLGQWDVEQYDEMLYLQNGVYHMRQGETWKSPKARGLDIASVAKPIVEEYLRNCQPGDFQPLHVQMRERFIGLNAAYMRAQWKRNSEIGVGVKEFLGRWEAGTREMVPGGKGKRVHIPKACGECQTGLSAWDSPHRLAIRSRSIGDMSTPHSLPWENGVVPDEMELARELDLTEGDMIFDDQ
jgi:hypothetical protein